MPLIVPVLRLGYVFLNVFDTFKVLRLPPLSSRNGGKPSVRAMSQRKRAMKGCLTVWLVWTCFVMYERTLDGMVRLFIPFYDEVKSVVILFFLVSRARGAEPIYLHVIRPAVKPYAPMLDPILEAAHMLGDLVLLAASIPIQIALGYYYRWTSRARRFFNERMHPSRQNSNESVSGHASRASKISMDAPRSRENGILRPPAQRGISSASSGIPVASTRITRSTSRQEEEPPVVPPPPSYYEIWHPPPSSYDPNEVDFRAGLPTPPIDSSPLPQPAVDEWRQYPPFPSAYPPTPLPASSRLPPVAGSAPSFTGIPEEEPANSGVKRHETRQGFRGSLPLPHESLDPDRAGGESDEHRNTPGVQSESGEEEKMDVEEEKKPVDSESEEERVEDEEDDFDVTLRTPSSMKIRKEASIELKDEEMQEEETYKNTAPVMMPSVSIDSLATQSTALSTEDGGSSLRTRTNSQASSSGLSSMAGRKRRIPRVEYGNADTRKTKASQGKNKTTAGNARPTAAHLHMRAAASRQPSRKPSQDDPLASTAEDTAETDSDLTDDASSDLKRRRVPAAPGGRVGRPTVKREDSNKTIRGPVNVRKVRPSARKFKVTVEEDGGDMRGLRKVTEGPAERVKRAPSRVTTTESLRRGTTQR